MHWNINQQLKHKVMKGFISQLKDIEGDFKKRIKDQGFTLDKKTLTYKIIEGSIKMSVECRDSDGLFVECFAYIRTDNDSLYQSEIDAEGIFMRRP